MPDSGFYMFRLRRLLDPAACLLPGRAMQKKACTVILFLDLHLDALKHSWITNCHSYHFHLPEQVYSLLQVKKSWTFVPYIWVLHWNPLTTDRYSTLERKQLRVGQNDPDLFRGRQALTLMVAGSFYPLLEPVPLNCGIVDEIPTPTPTLPEGPSGWLMWHNASPQPLNTIEDTILWAGSKGSASQIQPTGHRLPTPALINFTKVAKHLT